MTKKHGLTILEIMIVVAIISLLAAAGIPCIIHGYSNSLEKIKAKNVARVETAKGVLTLPPAVGLAGAMSLHDMELDLVSDSESRTNLCAALSIRDLDELKVGGTPIRIGSLSVRASYLSADL